MVTTDPLHETTVAVIGAGGRIGRALTRVSSNRGLRVRAIVRDVAGHGDLVDARVALTPGDALDQSTLARALEYADLVVTAVTPFSEPPVSFDGFDGDFYARVVDNVLEAGRAHSVRRFAFVGSFSTLRSGDRRVADDPDLFPPRLRPFAEAHARGADRLLARGADLDWVLLAPATATGPGDGSLTEYSLGDDSWDDGVAAPELTRTTFATAVIDELVAPTRVRELVGVRGAR